MAYVAAATAVVGIGAGVIKGIGAHNQGKKDAAAAANLKNPFYKIQDEYYQNRNIAAGQAGSGLPSDTKNYMTSEAQRGLGTSISAINSGGGNPNDIARLFGNYENSIASTGAADADAHVRNIQYYMAANKDLAGQKTTRWAVNEKQPYENKLKELTQRRAADAQNEQNGWNTAIGSLTGGVTGMQNAKLLNLLSKKGNKTDPFTPSYEPVDVAQTRGMTPSPAGNYGSIDPNSGTQFNFPSSQTDDEDISTLE